MLIVCRKIELDEEPPWQLLMAADPSRDAILSYLDDGMCYKVYDSNDVVGVFVNREIKANTVEVMNIAVEESVRSKGLGSKMLSIAAAKAEALGAEYLEVGTSNASFGQLNFYQKNGFRAVGVDVGFFDGRYSPPKKLDGILVRDMIRLSKPLIQEHNNAIQTDACGAADL